MAVYHRMTTTPPRVVVEVVQIAVVALRPQHKLGIIYGRRVCKVRMMTGNVRRRRARPISTARAAKATLKTARVEQRMAQT